MTEAAPPTTPPRRRGRIATATGCLCLFLAAVIGHRLALWGTLLAIELTSGESGSVLDDDPDRVLAIDRGVLLATTLGTVVAGVLWLRSGRRRPSAEEGSPPGSGS